MLFALSFRRVVHFHIAVIVNREAFAEYHLIAVKASAFGVGHLKARIRFFNGENILAGKLVRIGVVEFQIIDGAVLTYFGCDNFVEFIAEKGFLEQVADRAFRPARNG